MFGHFFFLENRAVNNVEKYSGARVATNDVTIWRMTDCMLDKQGYMHALACTRPHFRAHARTHARTHTNSDM